MILLRYFPANHLSGVNLVHALFFLAVMFFSTTLVEAQPQRTRGETAREDLQVGQTIGDGKGGRVFNVWKHGVQPREVASVTVTLRRERGGDNTFVNLRFGSGNTFENGKRVYLKDGNTRSVSWNVNAASNGQPLVLNAYEGEVYVESVEISYKAQVSIPMPFSTGPKPTPHHDSSNDDDESGDDEDSYSNDYGSGTDDAEATRRCRKMYNMKRPRIELGQLRPSGGLFSGKYKVQGSISGVCISEAGYYEDGRLRDKIPFPYDDRFQRKEFSFTARSGRNGEVRAYNSAGDEDSVSIDDQIQDDGEQQQGNPFNF